MQLRTSVRISSRRIYSRFVGHLGDYRKSSAEHCADVKLPSQAERYAHHAVLFVSHAGVDRCHGDGTQQQQQQQQRRRAVRPAGIVTLGCFTLTVVSPRGDYYVPPTRRDIDLLALGMLNNVT